MNYRTVAPTLRANGYAPAGIPTGYSEPIGPWAAMQPDNATYDRGDIAATAAIFTYCKPAFGAFENAITQPADTWLATITAYLNDRKLDAILTKYLATSKSPMRVNEDGTTTRILRIASNGLWFLHRRAHARVEFGASFVSLAGDWRNGNPLVVPRAELPEITKESAQALAWELG